MKPTLAMFALLMSISGSAFAGPLNMDPNGPTEEQTLSAWTQFPFQVRHRIPGIHKGYIGVTACQVGTGTSFFSLSDEEIAASTFVNCLEIPTATKKAASRLLKMYPTGSKVANVYVVIEYQGAFVPQ